MKTTADTDVAALERDLVAGIRDGVGGHGCDIPSDDEIRARFLRVNGVSTETVAQVTSEVLREHHRSTRCGRPRR